MSSIGKIFNPLFEAISWLLAFYYSLIPNYAVAIALLTVTVMIVMVPLTVKSTRSMIEMQRLQPQIKKLQQEFKDDKLRQQQEMQALFKENGVSPAGGCLPMLLQLPIFLILYRVVRGLTNLNSKGQPAPKYIGQVASHSLLYQHLLASKGKLPAFGIDMAKSPLSNHSGFATALPFWILVALSVALQYVQYRQLMRRNPQSGASQQAQQVQQIQKYLPLVFGVIYIEIPAAVTVYFIISSLSRIIQQTLMYRYDPKLRTALLERRAAAGQAPAKIEEKAPPPPAGRQSRTTQVRTQRSVNGKASSPAARLAVEKPTPVIEVKESVRQDSAAAARVKSRRGAPTVPAEQPAAKQPSNKAEPGRINGNRPSPKPRPDATRRSPRRGSGKR